jgi:hypothetical protein
MDIEKLRLILETLQGVGHEAGSLAMLYLWLQFGSAAVTNLCIAAAILGAAYLGYRAIRVGYGADAYESLLHDMRNQLFPGTGGYLTDDERQRTMAAIRALVAEKRAKERQA